MNMFDKNKYKKSKINQIKIGALLKICKTSEQLLL